MRRDVYKILSAILLEAEGDVQTIQHEISHSLSTVFWLSRLTSHPPLVVEIAALCHDLDRYFIRHRVIRAAKDSYNTYKLRHTKRSAQLTTMILRKLRYPPRITKAVSTCIIGHEQGGGSPHQQLLTAADSLSFFDNNMLEYIAHAETMARVIHKIQFMYFRVSPRIQEMIDTEPFTFKKIPLPHKLFLRAIREGRKRYVKIQKK